MIRTMITIVSLAFTTAVLLWSQLHWHFLEERNLVLVKRLEFFQISCKETVKNNKKLTKRTTNLAQQLYIFEKNRPGRKENLATLKKLIKERNIKYGIGGR